jgi:hypothetical protein
MGNAPDVRVRLSAEGQKEILDAFKAIQADAEKTGRVGSRAMERFSAAARGLASVLPGLTFGAAVAGATLLFRRSVQTAAALSKLSERTGVAVETLSAYAHGAELSQVSTEQLATAFRQLSRGMNTAARDGGAALRPFKALGVEVRNQDGSLRELDAVLGDVADRFAGLADGAEKSAVAQELFGRSGEAMIPFLNRGRAGLEEFRREAERMGLVISKETAAAATEFSDNISRLRGVLQGASNTLLAEVGPSIAGLTTRMVEAARETENFKRTAEGVAAVFRGLATLGLGLFSVLEHIGIALGSVGTIAILIARRDWAGLKAALEETGREMARARKLNDELITAVITGSNLAKQGVTGVSSTIRTTLTPALKEATETGVNWLAVSQILGVEGIRALDRQIAQTDKLRRETDALVQAGARGAEAVEPSARKAEAAYADLTERIREAREAIEESERAQLVFADLIASSFASAVSGAMTFREALVQVLQQISFVIARALLLRAILAFLPAGTGEFLGFSQGGEVGGEGFARGGLVRRRRDGFLGAAGGFVRGPGTATSDSIPAMLSAGEYVIPARTVRQYGVDFFEGLRAMTASVRPMGRGYAAGGLVEAQPAGAGAAAGGRAELEIGLDEPMILKRFAASSEWDRLFVRTALRNRKSLRGSLR